MTEPCSTYPNIADCCTDFARELVNTAGPAVNFESLSAKLAPRWLGLLVIHLTVIRLTRCTSTVLSLDVITACIKVLMNEDRPPGAVCLVSAKPRYKATDEIEEKLPVLPIPSGKKFPRNINKKDSAGETRMHLVCWRNRTAELVELLRHAGNTPLHEACFHGNECAVDLLLKAARGVDPCARTADEETPLMEAVAQGHVNVCRLLLSHSVAGASWKTGALDLCLLPDLKGELEQSFVELKYCNKELPRLASHLVLPRDLTAAATMLQLYLHVFKVNEIVTMLCNKDVKKYATISFNYLQSFYSVKSWKRLKKVCGEAVKAGKDVVQMYYMLTTA